MTSFRTVLPTDPRAIAAVAAYLAEVAPGEPSPGELHELAPPDGAFVLAEDDAGTTIGCGGVRTIEPGVLEVKRMWVAPGARGRGIGRRLLGELERQAASLGARTVRLDTNDVLRAALALYASSGYVEIERYNDNPHARHWFGKELAPEKR